MLAGRAFGSSMTFDGGGTADDQITVAAHSSINDMAEKTISFWAYTASIGENSAGAVISKISSDSNFGWAVQTVATNKMRYLYRRSVASNCLWTSDNNTIVVNTWQHWVIRFDNVSAATCWLNGAAVTFTQSGTMGTALTDATYGLGIGCRATAADRTFNGRLMDVAIWSSILSDADVIYLYKGFRRRAPLQIEAGSLAGYWPLDECAEGVAATTASMFRDFSTNGNHGSPAGSPVGAAAGPLTYPDQILGWNWIWQRLIEVFA